MSNRILARASACVAVVLLAGCHSSYDRINAAIPLSPAAAEGKQIFEAAIEVNALDRSVARELEKEMDARAQRCAAGYVPGLTDSDADIRAALRDKRECFAGADIELRDWMVHRTATAMVDHMVPPELRAFVERTKANQPAAVYSTPAPEAAPETPGEPESPPMADPAPAPMATVEPMASVPAAGLEATNAARRESIERSIRENNLPPEEAERLREWARNIEASQ